jgi:hypothetical protein
VLQDTGKEELHELADKNKVVHNIKFGSRLGITGVPADEYYR